MQRVIRAHGVTWSRKSLSGFTVHITVKIQAVVSDATWECGAESTGHGEVVGPESIGVRVELGGGAVGAIPHLEVVCPTKKIQHR